MAVYPTGVENHGGFLRIWFMYKGERVREALGVPDTAKNRRIAGDLRAAICYDIKTGRFDYTDRFPNSRNLAKFGIERNEITLNQLAEKWLSIKEMELATSTKGKYESKIANTLPFIGVNRLASSVRQEDILVARKEMLTGFQAIGHGHKSAKRGRSVSTVNGYIGCLVSMFRFALANGYVASDPTANISPLTKSKSLPDPLSREEFMRMMDAIKIRQTRNLWSVAIYTGLRHGELCALSWEDIDLHAGSITVRRNLIKNGQFKLPKTAAGTDRIVQLVQPAIDALRDQAELTRLGRAHDITVSLREYGKTVSHKCTFVFNPSMTATNGRSGHHYSEGTIGQSWDSALRRAGIRHRKAYQSRHTYACWSLAAGANPNFIAQQMGHASAQMVYQVYGSWMAENNHDQINLLNQKLTEFAPSVPHAAINE
ncbi:site-specific integrase [Serratia marcescens]|uniref:tyrosine-type recombinase/integrase n=1 Tax=Serratia marcescens TaxID=615 RepID=UPI0011C8123C|nr:site-specific integrase [Serratia marcescens]TXE41381.1 site-specific integrase [Serratia marcescens]